MRYGADMNKALMAGLLHDCAKHMTADKLIKTCERHGIVITAAEQKSPYLLHAKVGAYLASEKYGVNDREILDAICCHTTGKPAMTLLEKIVFVADYIEPSRNQAPNLEQLRKKSFENIDEAVYLILKQTLAYLYRKKQAVDEQTEVTFNYYKDLVRETRMNDSRKMAAIAVEALQDKKAIDLKVIDIKDVSVMADYFIIVSGSNKNQVQALADNAEEMLGKAGYNPRQVEGYRSANWILMDYQDIIIHIFSEEDRLFYDLERIWRDGKTIALEELSE